MSDYNYPSKLLHKIALGNYAISKMSYSLDQNLVKKKYDPENVKKVFISGLARSGTTILTTYLSEIDNFFSLTYQDMPFPLMPNVWRKLNVSRNPGMLKERKHGDNIKINYQSAEEIEEYFWKVFSNDGYIDGESLNFDEVSGDEIQKYNDYINAILNCYGDIEDPIYLSKNNNQVLRLKRLFRRLPEAYFIIPFREPLSHAWSLLSQHRRFTELQQDDHFILQYMNWLGHHEFGLNHKYFNLENERLNEMIRSFDEQSLNYWLTIWLNYYTYITDFKKEISPKGGDDRILLFCYENFCTAPYESIESLGKIIGFKPTIKPDSYDIKTYHRDGSIDPDLIKECDDLYDRMIRECVN